ncbi:COP23 domain-containing protein [Floridanema aerugineum]|uniref:COP23 domain-containing protein n=1 Tax=Floridaenema aerugineum BLCC-F46 TaxID=3153654 RepID=A0ABV4X6H9_9CYAN
MKIKYSIPVLLATIALSSAAIFPSPARAQFESGGSDNSPAPSRPATTRPATTRPATNRSTTSRPASNAATVFRCIRQGNEWVTIAQKGTRRTGPMITWRTAVGEFSQQERCQQVSTRLTRAVAQNGGDLSRLLLTSGRVNGQTVICFVNSAERCNSGNVLFTLVNPRNAASAGDVLAKLVRFGSGRTGSPGVFESGGGDNQGGNFESGGEGETQVSLQEAVDNAFAAGSFESGGGDEENTSEPTNFESGASEENSPVENPSNDSESQTEDSSGPL